jgi:hypothetical protein
MRKFLLALSLLSSAVSSDAFAQQQRSGTPEEQKACSRDVQRFCRPVIDQGDFTILRPGAENPRPISRLSSLDRRARPVSGVFAGAAVWADEPRWHWFWRRIPLYGARDPSHALEALARAAMPDQCSQFY